MNGTRLRKKPRRVLAAAQPTPRWQTQMRKERRIPSNSCLSIQLGEDMYTQKQLAYFIRPLPSAGQRVTGNSDGGAVPTPALDLDIPELFPYQTFSTLFATTVAAPTLRRVATET